MQIIFRKSCEADLNWYRHYYSHVFPQGSSKAKQHFNATYQALLAHAFIGHPIEANPHIRELQMPGTPFSFIYTVRDEEILILRVLDGRAQRPTSFPAAG
jgi:plasmid stabilization system protein ParE